MNFKSVCVNCNSPVFNHIKYSFYCCGCGTYHNYDDNNELLISFFYSYYKDNNFRIKHSYYNNTTDIYLIGTKYKRVFFSNVILNLNPKNILSKINNILIYS